MGFCLIGLIGLDIIGIVNPLSGQGDAGCVNGSSESRCTKLWFGEEGYLGPYVFSQCVYVFFTIVHHFLHAFAQSYSLFITRFGGRCCRPLQQLGVAHHRSSGVGKTV